MTDDIRTRQEVKDVLLLKLSVPHGDALYFALIIRITERLKKQYRLGTGGVKRMGLIDADKLIEEFEKYDMYLWRLPKKENPYRDAFRSQLNWCINKVRDHEKRTAEGGVNG